MRKLLVGALLGAMLLVAACGSFGNDRRAQAGRIAPSALVVNPTAPAN